MSLDSWTSIPWTPLGSPQVAWQKQRVPYVPSGTYLHTLDLWMPLSPETPDAPPAEQLPRRPEGPWIIYIHGGAWRDPLVDSSSFDATALKILQAASPPVAGIASLNYPLSIHPNHPTHPAPPRDPSVPLDPAREAKHPDHVRAVIDALAYLQNDLGVAHDYILAGHSCGATLAFQVAMDSAQWTSETGEPVARFRKPGVLVGLNGLYDLAHFISHPPSSHEGLISAYDEFTRGAFGDDEATWRAVCPTSVGDWAAAWPEGKAFYVVQSREDGLVPYSQTELMKKRLAESSSLPVVELEAGGDHNDLWKEGGRLAEIMLEVLRARSQAA